MDDPDELVGSGEAEDADAVQAKREWRVWVLAMAVLTGVILVFAPGPLRSELVGTLGVAFIVLGVVGWIVRWIVARRE